ncbi:MAG: hypothetical protein JNM43_27055 [Planctomycetaceae bacterium]|nr:hypothetical protein [Planctomycetaceae bacterium]
MKRFRLRCPACKSGIEVPAETISTTFECPQCHSPLRLKQPVSDAPSALERSDDCDESKGVGPKTANNAGVSSVLLLRSKYTVAFLVLACLLFGFLWLRLSDAPDGQTQQHRDDSLPPRSDYETARLLFQKFDPAVVKVDRTPGANAQWRYSLDEQKSRWNLEVDPGPSFEDIAELSLQYSLIPVDSTDQLVLLQFPNSSTEQILIDVVSRRGKRLRGTLLPRSKTNGSGLGQKQFSLQLQGRSPDGEFFLQSVMSHDGIGDQLFVTVHEFDNSLVRVIRNAHAAQFVSKQKFLTATRDDNAQHPRRKDDFAAQTLSFWDLAGAEPQGSVRVAAGGHWALTPNRKYLVVIQPDEETVRAIEQTPEEPYQCQCQSVRLQLFDSASGELLVSCELDHKSVGESAVFSHDGTRLALVSDNDLLIVSMADGKVIAGGSVPENPDQSPNKKRFPRRWIAGTDYFQIGDRIIAVKDGRTICDSTTRSAIPVEVKADWYARDTIDGAYTKLKPESFDRRYRYVTPNTQPPDNDREAATLDLKGTDSRVLQELMRLIIPGQLHFRMADKAGPYVWHVEITYSETSSTTSGVELLVTCKDDRGRLISEETVQADVPPSEWISSVPAELQLRAMSLVSACRNLKPLPVPAQTQRHDLAPDSFIWSGQARSEQRNPLSGEFTIENTTVDNSWIGGSHGIPIPE